MRISDVITTADLKKLFESMTTILPFRKITNDNIKTTYGFEYNDASFIVDLRALDIKVMDVRIYSTTFYEADPNNPERLSFKQTLKNKYTGPLFKTVSEIIKDSSSLWDVLTFTSESNRIGLYTQLAKKMSGGYHVYTFQTSAGGMWVISKIKLKKEEIEIISNYAATEIASKV